MNDIKLLDYNSARHLANKKAGEVVDVIGDTEFCGKKILIALTIHYFYIVLCHFVKERK